MYNYGITDTYIPSTATKNLTGLASAGIWAIIALVLAIVGGLVLYFTFLSKKNEGKFTGFLGWLYNFLNFKELLAEKVIRILYLIVALFITLSSFSFISVNFLAFLGYLVLGNIATRLVYEFLLLALILCKNTSEINEKMNK